MALPNLRVIRTAPDRWTVERLVYIGPIYDELVTVGEIYHDRDGYRALRATGDVGGYIFTDDGIAFSIFEDAVLKLAHHQLPDEVR